MVPTVRWTLRHFNQLAIESVFKTVILGLQAAPPDMARDRRVVEYRGQVDPLRLPVGYILALDEAIDPADHVIDRSEAKLGHESPQIFGDEEEEIDHVLGLALEFLAEFRVLRGHAHRAGV
jgi:hypothetical protein